MERKKKIRIMPLIVCILIPLAVGGISAFLTKDSMAQFASMNQPPLSPPGILFPIAWTILYILMGIASYLVFASGSTTKRLWLVVYAIQLAFKFLWSPFFFNLHLYWFAFVWLLALWAMILFLILSARKINKNAVLCLVPYILWCTFAAYLNAGVAVLN